jgi:excinuclease UvrABC nuclease subunit
VLKAFDRKFGPAFFDNVPTEPGVYRVYSTDEKLIYVGKAKNLRRRLGQYRNARRRKKHLKMRSIVRDAARIEFDTCASELDACLLENRLIQSYRPKWNVAGAFHFMYPMIGTKVERGEIYFACTTSPAKFSDFELHGAFRSRHVTREAFFALMELLAYIGHPVARQKLQTRPLFKRLGIQESPR